MTSLQRLIQKSEHAFRNRDALALRRISGQAITEAVVEQHREVILLALVDYALSKLLSKTHYQEISTEFFEKIDTLFKLAAQGDKKTILKSLEKIEDEVMKFDEKHGHYQDNIMQKSRIRKAAKLYDKGLSLTQASELTGAPSAEVLDYASESKTVEFHKGAKVDKKLKTAREVLK